MIEDFDTQDKNMSGCFICLVQNATNGKEPWSSSHVVGMRIPGWWFNSHLLYAKKTTALWALKQAC